MENMETQWSKLLDQIVNRLTALGGSPAHVYTLYTMCTHKLSIHPMESRPLIIQAACHPVGHMLVVGLTKMVKKTGDDTRRRMLEMIPDDDDLQISLDG